MKGIIFDLDGVIISTDQYHFQAWKHVADIFSIPFDEEINHRLRGISREKSLDIILECYTGPRISSELKTAILQEKNNRYKCLLEEIKPSDVSNDVRATIKEMKQMGYQIAIGSSSKNATYILKLIKMFDEFDAVIDGNHIKRSKPDPEVFLKAAKIMQLEPEDCIVVEDALSGILAAKEVNMITVGIGDACMEAHPDYYIKRLTDLITVCKNVSVVKECN